MPYAVCLAAAWLTTPAGAATPTPTGQWDFDFGDLRATLGNDLQYVGDTTNLTTFGVTNINGHPAHIMGFGANSSTQGFLMRHGAKPNGGGHLVNQYTLILDLMYPAASSDQLRALLQTDPFNHSGNDADFYVGDNHALPVPDGFGADGQFDGPLAPETWYRIAFAVDLTAPAGQQLTKYVNGAKAASQSLAGGIDGRYALGPIIQLFTSGLSGGSFTQPGFVNSIQFYSGCLPPDAIAALGGPTAGGLAPANSGMQLAIVGATPATVTLSWVGRNGPFQLEFSTNFFKPRWAQIGAPTTNHFITVPKNDALCLYRVKEVSPLAFGLAQQIGGESLLPSGQIIHSAGQVCYIGGRPVDLVLSMDGSKIFIKNYQWVQVIDLASWRLQQTLGLPPGGASKHGITVSKDGTHLYVTGTALFDYIIAPDGTLTYSRSLTLPSGADACGVAISADGSRAYVCLGMRNTLGVIDLASGSLILEINVGMAPWDVALSPNETTAYVSDWGGRRPLPGDLVGTSTGQLVVVDERGIGASGVVSFVDLTQNTEVAEVNTGLHPSDIELTPDGSTLYVANANSDTVTVINTQARAVQETILIRPDPTLPFGSDSDGLSLSKDGKYLFVAAAGNNAVALVELPNGQHTNSVIQGFVPTDWYPGAVVTDGTNMYVANVKGAGSVPSNLFNYLGTASKIPLPQAEALSKYTAQVQENCLLPRVVQTQAPARTGQAPLPVPKRVGEPSVFQHVVYIIKENKTYDNILGDMPQGNGNTNCCLYPQPVTPNHHAIAAQYVLLDNYYCNGVLSADGHSWCVEGHSTDHVEKSFGLFGRGYPLGSESLTYSSSGFIWNNAVAHGLTYRNYGELNNGYSIPGASWSQIYADYTNHTGQFHYGHIYGVTAMIPYTSTNVPGWNLAIPDVVRAQGFIQELHDAEAAGSWASLHVLYLPNDHTAGTYPGFPTPLAQVADNDLAVGQVVEAVTKSRFGSNTCTFIIEDDPQYSLDHVDGHRSLCLIISPYTRRNQTLSTFYTQAGVVHTIEQILGLPPMNQHDAVAPLMSDCFTNVPDFTPYTAVPNVIPLDTMNPATASLDPQERYWAKKSRQMDLSKPDLVNENTFNRIIWHSVRGKVRYPAAFAGPHGKGLKKLGLALDPTAKKDDDD